MAKVLDSFGKVQTIIKALKYKWSIAELSTTQYNDLVDWEMDRLKEELKIPMEQL